MRNPHAKFGWITGFGLTMHEHRDTDMWVWADGNDQLYDSKAVHEDVRQVDS
jgi:hypothetical protein